MTRIVLDLGDRNPTNVRSALMIAARCSQLILADIADVRWVAEQIDSQIDSPRPLIVLDLTPAQIQRFIRSLRATQHASDSEVADAIEAQTKPARIEEPGLWGVVEASSVYVSARLTYLHTNESGDASWNSSRGSCSWPSLIDPTLIRAGVES